MTNSESTNPDFLRIQRNLTALIDFSRNVNSNLDLSFTLNNLLLSCLGKFLSSRGFVALLKDNKLRILHSKGVSQQFIDSFPEIGDLDESKCRDIKEIITAMKFPLCEIIESSGKKLGVLALGEKINKQEYSDDEREFLKTILNIAGTAIRNSFMIDELKLVNRSLDSRINRLSSLFELSKEFSLLTEDERIGKLLLYSLLGHFPVMSYAIIYNGENKIKILESTVPKNQLAEIFRAINIADIRETLQREQFIDRIPALEKFKFQLMVPMTVQGTTRGILLLGNRVNQAEYIEDDIEFIVSIASLAVISLENRRLFREALEKQRLEEELEIAKEIQRNLLPKSLPVLKNFDIAATTIASKQVGGDYYDIIELNDGKICSAIADVSGKGVPASLLMANLQAFLKSICKQELHIKDATALLNDLISENTSDGRFITFFWAHLDDDRRLFTYVNAGHNAPLLLRKNSVQYLDKGGMIFGVMKTLMPYESEEIQLESGDVIVLFTDGVTEAKNIYDEEYSDTRLEELLLNNASKNTGAIMEIIQEDVKNFTQGAPQSDDITIVVIKVK